MLCAGATVLLLYGEGGSGARGSSCAPPGAAPLPEATPSYLNFKLQSSNQPVRYELHDVMPSVKKIFSDFSGQAGRPRPFHISHLLRCLLLIGKIPAGCEETAAAATSTLISSAAGGSGEVLLLFSSFHVPVSEMEANCL